MDLPMLVLKQEAWKVALNNGGLPTSWEVAGRGGAHGFYGSGTSSGARIICYFHKCTHLIAWQQDCLIHHCIPTAICSRSSVSCI